MHVPHGMPAAEIRQAAQLDDAAFAARFGRAMLMVHSSADPERVDRTGPYRLDELRTGDTFIAFIPIIKTDRNQFNFISVGRTGNNDVVLVDTTLSKFHAYIREDAGVFFLLDAGSRNGTQVDGVQVPVRGKGDAIALTRACEIRFGSIPTTFMPLMSVRRFVAP
jgi:hypothetical protein